MTEFIITVSDESDNRFLKKVFKSIEGVVDVKIKKDRKANSDDEDWLDGLMEARSMIDKSLIDWDDEKTQYLL